MKRLFALIFLTSLLANAGLPPTTSKLSSDSNNVTTFNYQFPNFTGTHTGTTVALGINSVAGGGTGTNSFTTGSIPFMGATALTQDNNNLFWDNTNKRLGIGVAGSTPSAVLDVHNASTNLIAQFNNTGTQGSTAGAFVNAVSDPGAAMSSGSRLGIFGFAGAFDTSHTVSNSSVMQAFATENWSSSAKGSKLVFQTTTNGTTGLNNVLTLDNDKSASFTGALNVTGTTTLATSLTGPVHAASGVISASAINLANTDVTGVLPIANGGTNNGSLAVTAGGVLYTDGTKVVNVGAGSSGQFLKSNGSSAPAWGTGSYTPIAPAVQRFLSGTGTYYPTYYFYVSSANATVGATYTNNAQTCTVEQTISSGTTLYAYCTGTPTSSGTLTKSGGTGDATITFSSFVFPLSIDVKMIGGGGGGGGGGSTAGTAAGAGGNTTFGSSLLTANGGSGGGGGGTNGVPGAGGAATINSPAITIIASTGGVGQGGDQHGGSHAGTGGVGCNSPLGGSGAGGVATTSSATSAAANSGSGGGGGGDNGATSTNSGAGGSCGAYIEARLSPPSTSYSYAVGGAGSAGGGGTNGNGGATGGSGIIIVTEYYQ